MDKRIIVLILIVFVALIGGMIYLKKKRDAKAKAKAEARAAAMREEAKEAEEKATREAKERAAKEAEEESMRKAKEENDRAEAEAASKLKLLRIKQKKAAADAEKRRMYRADQERARKEKAAAQRRHQRQAAAERQRQQAAAAERRRQQAAAAERRRQQQADAEQQRKQDEAEKREMERQRKQDEAEKREMERQIKEQQAEDQQAEDQQQHSSAEMNSTQEKSTKPNHWGGGNSIYLDRHNVDCGNKALKGFHLRRPRGNQINYKYQCGGATSGAGIRKNSGTNHWGGGHTLYLDRHRVDCGPNPLHQFKLIRPNRHSVRYNYRCGNRRHAGRCRRANTGFNQGHRMSIYLDRHKIRCRNDEVLKSFKLNRQPHTGWPGKMRYDYECCKI